MFKSGSAGGALPSRPPEKMGRQKAGRVKYRRTFEVPAPCTSERQMLQKSANAKRRRQDKETE